MSNDIDIESLISEVSKIEILWNPRLKNYKNTTITNKKWAEVAFNLGLDPDTAGPEVKKKFKAIKDRYRRELTMPQPRSGSSGAEGDQTSTWPYFSLCGFLNDVMPNKTTDDNLGSNVRAPNNETIDTENDLDIDELESTISSDTTVSLVTPLKRTLKNQQMESILAMENKRLKLIESHLNNSKETASSSAFSPSLERREIKISRRRAKAGERTKFSRQISAATLPPRSVRSRSRLSRPPNYDEHRNSAAGWIRVVCECR